MGLFNGLIKYVAVVCFQLLPLIAGVSLPAQAELVFSAPPRENPQEGLKTYGPLADYLTKVLGEKVRYEHPGGWANYSADMRNDRYDIVFDAPHFGAWRIRNINHTPVVKLPGMLGFIIITNSYEGQLNKMRDLMSVKICALASPNLGTMTIYNMFNNPIYQPQIYEVKGGFKGVLHSLLSGRCRAAVIRENLYSGLKKEEKELIKIITHSEPIPEQTITISQRLLPKKNFITENLLSVKGSSAASNVLMRFGQNAKSFEDTNIGDYKNLDELLTGVVWGW